MRSQGGVLYTPSWKDDWDDGDPTPEPGAGESEDTDDGVYSDERVVRVNRETSEDWPDGPGVWELSKDKTVAGFWRHDRDDPEARGLEVTEHPLLNGVVTFTAGDG